MMLLAATVHILGQGVVVALLAKFIRSFGSYTRQLVAIHDTNVQIMEKQEALTEEIARLRDVA